jgi:multidrug resistance efflux pump
MGDHKETIDLRSKQEMPAPGVAAQPAAPAVPAAPLGEHKQGAYPASPHPGTHPPAHEKPNVITMIKKHPLAADAVFIIVLLALVGGFLYWHDASGKVYIEKAQISAPVIALSPSAPGIIDKFYVQEGDQVSQGQKLAMVGDEIITAKTQGIITWIQNTPGQMASPGQPVVKMVDPRQFRVVGQIAEDKGLADIKVGQKIVFTVDAFPGRQYNGVVDSIGTAATESDIVFSISDQRQERDFNVNAIFDVQAYSELKNGMSAKMWVYKS